jgi:surfeit locus 1 family protein
MGGAQETPLLLTLRTSRLELRLSLPWLLLTAIGVCAFVALGRWQWHRAAEKRLVEASFAATAAADAVPLAGRSLAEISRYGRVEAAGRYDSVHQLLLDNITQLGQAGYDVLTPLELSDGRWLLVNRGWVPLVGRSRRELPDVQADLPEGQVVIRGRVDELPVAGLAAGRVPATAGQGWPRVTSFPQTSDLAAALGRPLEPRQLLLAADQPGGYLRNWQPSSASFPPERHVANAVQWWSLACLAAGLYLFMNFKRRNT